MSHASRCLIVGFGFAAMVVGCAAKPNPANIGLRKQVQDLEESVAKLQAERDAANVAIKTLETGRPTVPTLPTDRLNALFTTHGIKIGRLTGGADFDPQKLGDEGLKIYLTPTDEAGDELKAAGAIAIEAFDLTAGDTRVGKWEFSAADARKFWNGAGLLYDYVIPCAWQSSPPVNEQLTLKITFTDELTGRSYSEQKLVTVKLNR